MALAYGALILAMLISSGNFLFGNLAVDEISPAVLTFWRTFIAMICLVPYVVKSGGVHFGFLTEDRNFLKYIVLTATGVVICPWLLYIALISDQLIELGVGYSSMTLITILFSALILHERLNWIQYIGIVTTMIGALIFVFDGSFANLMSFKIETAFLIMIASVSFRALYLVLLKKWAIRPKPSEGLFALFVIGTLMLSPMFIMDTM
ncbi:MAG: DMT family transporter, partial [Pseudomonadota bacterium]